MNDQTPGFLIDKETGKVLQFRSRAVALRELDEHDPHRAVFKLATVAQTQAILRTQQRLDDRAHA